MLMERPIRQKVKINKDIGTLPEEKEVWYCGNCGDKNSEGLASCTFCGTVRTTEERKTVAYIHDTYSAVHSENISAGRDGGKYDTLRDWLTKLLGGGEKPETAASIPNFRFKAYLKSNLERLYRDEDVNITWTDRNGNRMKPVYEDTDQDGNYDTFTWQYEEAYGGKTVDFQAFIFCGDCYSSGFSASDWREPEDCEGRAEGYGYQGRDYPGAVCPSVRVGAGSVCDSGDGRV